MRLDPKYFNLFLACCALVTIAVILYATIRYHQQQENIFRNNIESYDLSELYLSHVTRADSVQVPEFKGQPLIIDFWASWSDKSQKVHTALGEAAGRYPDLKILAAAVRDDTSQILDYINRHDYPFSYVAGTGFYQELQVPGIPSQIFIDRSGRYFDLQIGDDIEELNMKIEALMKNESN
ncbi:MAG: TlpA disulfide reductase family protein [Balneolaceae bacterium]